MVDIPEEMVLDLPDLEKQEDMSLQTGVLVSIFRSTPRTVAKWHMKPT